MRDRMTDGDCAAMAARDGLADVTAELGIAEAQIAKWINPGTRVDYCSVIGRPPIKRGLTVRSEPFKANSGHWAVFLNGHSGYVSVLAVQPSEEP